MPLIEVDVAESIMPYVTHREDEFDVTDREVLQELPQAQEALEREMTVSQRVKAFTLEEVNLGTSDTPKPVNIAKEMETAEKTAMIELLKEFRDVFTWSYEDMRGLDPKLYQHQIHLSKDGKSVALRRYWMKQNDAQKVKEEIDMLLIVGFIWPVKQATWLSLIVIVPKKNRRILFYVDYDKLNANMVTDAFPLPFTDSVLDAVAKHEVYSFLDGFSGYNQIRIHSDDQQKTSFVTEWGVFGVIVMMLDLKTASATFQRIIREIFEE